MIVRPKQFQHLLLTWFDVHGRKQLPWQYNKTPYRVWVSEIMLQQTQVSTVIPYFERFMQQFPDLATLAEAKEDAVLHLWAGLGYYSRARNLHRAAKMVMSDFEGRFPDTLDTLQLLPGIGRSTAGAILSIAFQQAVPILDGNVKRVLTRVGGINKPVNDKKVETELWQMAEQYTPIERSADYTQAIMDLGATLCTRSKPRCPDCPILKHCVAHQQNLVTLLPLKVSKKRIPVRTATFVILKQGDHVLLNKRPASGIWGGLFSLPEISGAPEAKTIRLFCQQQYQLPIKQYDTLPAFRHTFSHYHLDIHPIIVTLKKRPAKIMDACSQVWYNPRNPDAIGLPKPVQLIMSMLL